MSLIVIFRHLPGDAGGASTIIQNLFTHADENVVIAGRKPRYTSELVKTGYQQLVLPFSNGAVGKWTKMKQFYKALSLCLSEIKKNNRQKILGVYRDETSFVLSYILSLVSRLPMYVYMTDLYAENYDSRYKAFLQKLIFKRSKRIFCLNASMKEFYTEKGYENVQVIPSTIVQEVSFKKATYSGEVFRIVFSGSIVYDRLDLLQQLVSVIANRPEFELVFYSPQDYDFLKANALYASNVSREFLTNPQELVSKLQKAHLLYLPLTFAKPNDKRGWLQLKTCLGTKSYEYMQSGVPILVHSPASYYTYQFFEERKSAILLDSPDIDELRLKLKDIRNNYTQYSRVAENAYGVLSNHDSALNLNRILEEMQAAN
jgi:glycosyltransferase involved in cell wall biosynthesis